MARSTRTLAISALAVAGMAAAATVAMSGAADAASCTGGVKYAKTTNTVRVTGIAIDLPELLTLCPGVPVLLKDTTAAAANTYLLTANLVVDTGGTVRVRGTGSGVDPALAVDVLHLLSRPYATVADVASITAKYGTLDFASTHVSSWDDQAGAVDTTYDVPAVASAVGRAFVRAISYLDGVTKAPMESRMDITDSELSYLGYYASESYGVSYKGENCDKDHLDVCAALNVYGSERNSHFHHNFMGTYTFDAFQMVFDHNEYDHNVMYGLDPHDDSDQLTITNNHAHYNGDHGIICSQRCDHLTITGNESDHNGYPTPFVPPGDDNVGDKQVHGIMIHRGVTDSLIADNNVHDNRGAGIAVFDSFHNVISANTLSDNQFGLRSSVGSHDNTYSGNTITGSTGYAINAYVGGNAPYYGIASGHPTNEVFTGNTIDGTGDNVVNLLNTDGFQFRDNVVTGVVGKLAADSSTGLVWDGDSAPGLGVYLSASSRPSLMSLRLPLTPFKVSPGAAGSVELRNPGGRLVDVSGRAPFATVTTAAGVTTAVYMIDTSVIPSGSSMVTPRPVTVVPTGGAIQARMAGWTSATTKHVYLQGDPGTKVKVSWGSLPAGATYYTRDSGGVRTSRTTDGAGTLSWTITLPNSAVHDLTIRLS